MPWKETDVTEERVRFIFASASEEWTMAELCKAFGVSRKTGYKMLQRYKGGGLDALRDQSRAPHGRPNKTPEKIVKLLIKGRKAHPNWGPRKLIPWLERRHPGIYFPAPSTAGDILKKHGLVKSKKRQRTHTPKTQPFLHVAKPNDVWCADHKGWFRTKDGSRCDPLTITDCHSRFLLTCRGCPSTRHEFAEIHFKKAFKEFGLPLAIRTDNGGPFSFRGLAGLSYLSVWWIKLGIIPERIDPGRPDQNGRHERMHRTLKQETAFPPEATMEKQQRSFNHFVREYNNDRPHEALGNKTPSECYEVSTRKYPSRLRGFEYEGHLEVGLVDHDGTIKWRGKKLYLSPILRGELVGFEQVSERRWKVWLGPMEIALLDSRSKELLKYTKCVLRPEHE